MSSLPLPPPLPPLQARRFPRQRRRHVHDSIRRPLLPLNQRKCHPAVQCSRVRPKSCKVWDSVTCIKPLKASHQQTSVKPRDEYQTKDERQQDPPQAREQPENHVEEEQVEGHDVVEPPGRKGQDNNWETHIKRTYISNSQKCQHENSSPCKQTCACKISVKATGTRCKFSEGAVSGTTMTMATTSQVTSLQTCGLKITPYLLLRAI